MSLLYDEDIDTILVDIRKTNDVYFLNLSIYKKDGKLREILIGPVLTMKDAEDLKREIHLSMAARTPVKH